MDKNCTIEPGVVIGEDAEADRKRFPFITQHGIVILPKGTNVPLEGPIEFTEDMAFLLERDKTAKEMMSTFQGTYKIAKGKKHSHDSSGPRYNAYGPGALQAGAQESN